VNYDQMAQIKPRAGDFVAKHDRPIRRWRNALDRDMGV
jgi:hypothetical protein